MKHWLDIYRDLTDEQKRKVNDLGDKCCAKIALLDKRKKIIPVTDEEWYGINKLKRDDEL